MVKDKEQSEALVGEVLHDTYRLTRLIAEGGMGSIYEAVHVTLSKKKFAVKVLHPYVAKVPNAYTRFRREAEIATELGHPNIIDVLDFRKTDTGQPYLVMEYLEGEDLGTKLERHGRISPAAVMHVMKQVGSGLQSANDQGIVHRDMKPENIFIVGSGRAAKVKILDFGISKIRHRKSVVTQDQAVLGTPYYMSPEQAEGEVRDIDHATDIFALGSICYQCLSGSLPFDAPTMPGVVYKICHVDPRPLSSLIENMPESVDRVLGKAMAKKKRSRYQRAEEFVQDLGQALAERKQSGLLQIKDLTPKQGDEAPPKFGNLLSEAEEASGDHTPAAAGRTATPSAPSSAPDSHSPIMGKVIELADLPATGDSMLELNPEEGSMPDETPDEATTGEERAEEGAGEAAEERAGEAAEEGAGEAAEEEAGEAADAVIAEEEAGDEDLALEEDDTVQEEAGLGPAFDKPPAAQGPKSARGGTAEHRRAPTTLSRSVGEKEKSLRPRGGRRKVLMLAAGLMAAGLVAGVIILVGRSSTDTKSTAAVEPTQDHQPAPGVPPPSGEVPNAAGADEKKDEEIQLVLQLKPPSAQVYLDGELQQHNPLVLPRSDKDYHLEVKATGYKPMEQTVRADLNRTLRIVLAKRMSTAVRSTPKKAAKKSPPRQASPSAKKAASSPKKPLKPHKAAAAPEGKPDEKPKIELDPIKGDWQDPYKDSPQPKEGQIKPGKKKPLPKEKPSPAKKPAPKEDLFDDL